MTGSERSQPVGRTTPVPFASPGTGQTSHGRPATLVSIQDLRAFAASAVMLFHLKLLGVGFAGVDVFFVISGLIMGTVGVRETPATFLRRRLVRIAPLYWIVTGLTCALSLLPGAMRSFRFDATSLAKSLLFIPYRNGDGDILPLLVPGWTLNYEMFFYIVFAALLAFRRPRAKAIALLLVLGGVGAIVPFQDPVAATFTSPLLVEFAAGLALSIANPIRGGLLGALVLMLGLGGFAAMAVAGDLGITGIGRVLWLGIPAMLVVAGALAIERAGKWPRIPGAKAIGDASYSLYLTHGLVLAATARIALHLGLNRWLEMALGVGVSFLVAVLIYNSFERPAIRWFRRGDA